jgi:hypothetical protein
VGALLMPDTASAAPPVGLSITLGDAVQQVHPHQRATYSVTLDNQGGRAVSGHLVLETPNYVVVSDRHGTGKHQQTWSVTVPAGKSVTRTAAVRIGSIPPTELRVTSLAWLVRGRVGSLPLVRTADADRIAGVRDPARSISAAAVPRRPAALAPDSSGGPAGLIGWSLAAFVAAVVAGGVILHRRRSRRADAADGEGMPGHVPRYRSLGGQAE